MVLSRKKLKRKLRDLLPESQSGPPESTVTGEDAGQQLQCIKEILRSQSKERRKRRKVDPANSQRSEVTDQKIEVTSESVASNEKKKKKKKKKKSRRNKTKRDDGSGGDGAAEAPVDGKEKESEGKKRKEKKKERWRKNGLEDNKRNDEGNEAVNVDGNHEGSGELSNVERSGQNGNKVYVGGIPFYSSEDDIISFFEGCGTVTEVDCMTFPESGKFRGIAILTFKSALCSKYWVVYGRFLGDFYHTEAAATRALALDGADMGGFYLKIQPYKSNRVHKSDFAPEIVEGYNRIYAGNLSWDITEDDLRKFFSNCKILSIRFGTDKATGDFKGYAHVDFSDSASLSVAMKLDQAVVCGRPVLIRCAVPKKKVETKSSLEPIAKKDEGSTIAGSSKKKRRTCYVCGVPGHLSSSCPKKSAASSGAEN